MSIVKSEVTVTLTLQIMEDGSAPLKVVWDGTEGKLLPLKMLHEAEGIIINGLKELKGTEKPKSKIIPVTVMPNSDNMKGN